MSANQANYYYYFVFLKKKRVPQQRSKCMTYGTEIPVDFLMTNICLLLESRAMSGNRKCIKKMSINKRTFVGLNH